MASEAMYFSEVAIDWDADGAFTGSDVITSYVKSAQWQVGNQDPMAHIAQVDQLSLTLNNADRRFSPAYASGTYYGKLIGGKPVRLKVTNGAGTWTKFYGFTSEFVPTAGVATERECYVKCISYLDRLQGHEHLSMPLVEDKTADVLIRHVINIALGAPAASLTLTASANLADGDTVTLTDADGNSEIYRCKAALAQANDFLRGTRREDSLYNLSAAANGAEGSGTLYHASTTRPDKITANAPPELPTRATMWFDSAVATTITGTTFAIPASTPYNMVFGNVGPPGDGDEYTLACYLQEGSYTLYALGRTSSDRPIIDYYLNGTLIASGQDWYSASGVSNIEKNFAVSIPTSGYQKILIKVNGHNASSSGYTLRLTKIWLKQVVD